MKIIGIETSSIQGGVAVLETQKCARDKSNRKRLIASESIILLKQLLLKQGLLHGKLLIPALEKLLTKARWQPEDIDLVAVDVGPGSYTGLRVGLAIAKTIAHIIKSKIVGVSSLDVLVANIQDDYGYVCPVIDARWNQVYTAIYERRKKTKDERKKNGEKYEYKLISDYLAISPEDLIKLLKRYTKKADEKLLLFGDGLKSYEELFDKSNKNRKVVFGSADLWVPEAGNVALLGYESFKHGRHDDPIKLVPLYLRLTEAEVNLKKHKIVNGLSR